MSVPVVLAGCAFVAWGSHTIANILRPETQSLTTRGLSAFNLGYMVVIITLLALGGVWG